MSNQGNQFYTQAPNFVSAATGDVDPRTGLFSVSMPIANLVGNNNLGPALALTLSYAPLSTSNPLGLGIGCSLGLSYFDHANRLLTLNTGEQYPIIINSDKSVSVVQKKLDSFNFNYLKLNNKDTYQITYKTGQIEMLQSIDGGNTFLLMQVFTPAGHGLTLSWHADGDQMQLTQIEDEQNVLCQLAYVDNVSTTITVWPTSQETQVMKLTYQNNYLHQLINQSETPNLTWVFDYTLLSGYQLMTQVTAPTSYRQTVTYAANQQAFPSQAKLPALPAVTRYLQSPGFNQPPLLRTYDYRLHGTNNYLGNNGGMTAWNPAQDNLYSVMTSYIYGSTETLCDYVTGDVLSTTQRTYNNYHLLVDELSRQGNCSRETAVEYYVQIGVAYDNQPAQYQLPKTQTVTYTDTSKPEGQQTRQAVTQTTFDTWGNQLTNLAPDGTLTVWTYYPVAGAPQYCPPEPNGFVRFIETQTLTPAPSVFSAPVSTTKYSYRTLSGPVAGSPIDAVIVAWQEQHLSGTTPLSLKTTTYVDNPASAEHGRVQQVASTIDGSDGKSYTSQVGFTFAVQDEALVQTATFTGFDVCSATVGKSQSRYSGKTLSVTDRYGNQTAYRYDLLGRILSKTSGLGSEYESTSTTSYTLAQDNTGAITEISTQVSDAKGNAVRTYHDGMGRVLSVSCNDMDQAAQSHQPAAWYSVMSQQYDNLGRPAQRTAHDWLRAKAGGSETETTVQAEPFFDNWGQNYLTSYSDGHNAYGAYDPVTLQHVAQIQGQEKTAPTLLAKQVVQYSLQKLQAQATHYDSQGLAYGSQLSAYDGLKRLRQATDEMGNLTQYEYDAFGRVSKTTLPDATVVVKSYAPHSSSALIAGIQVTDGSTKQVFDLGSQHFDSLHRLLDSTSGGRTYVYHYEGANAQPHTMTTPLGEVVSYQYIPQLGNALQQVTVGEIQQTLEYYSTSDQAAGAVVGAMKTATEAGGMVRGVTYTPSGKLDTESFAPVGSKQKSTQFAYSLLGSPQYYQDVAGAAQTYDYYADGSAKAIVDEAIQVSLQYDTLGRFHSQSVTDTTTGKSLTTVVSLNDFNQEVGRDFYEDNAKTPTLSMTQSYWNNGQRKTRTTTQGSTTLRDEQTWYDARNRLQTYTCAGTALPLDPYGKAIEKQTFSYDGLSNITQCVTTFAGGSDTATFIYSNKADPTQLITVTHSHPDYPASLTVQYDGNGRMKLDEAGRNLGYDGLGRLQSVSGGGSPGGTYLYDALDTLVGQVVAGSDKHELYYRSNILINEFSSATQQQTRYVKLGNSCVGQSTEPGVA